MAPKRPFVIRKKGLQLWIGPCPHLLARKENENRVFACTTSNYSGFFSMVKPGSSSSTTETDVSAVTHQVLERLPPVLMAWRSACQASRFFWEKVWKWVPECSQLAGCYALVVHGGSLSCGLLILCDKVGHGLYSIDIIR